MPKNKKISIEKGKNFIVNLTASDEEKNPIYELSLNDFFWKVGSKKTILINEEFENLLVDKKIENNSEIEYVFSQNHEKFSNKKVIFKIEFLSFRQVAKLYSDLKNELLNYQIKFFQVKKEQEDEKKKFEENVKFLTEKANSELSKHKQQTNEKLNSEIEEIKKYSLQKFIENFANPLINFINAIEAGKKIDNPQVKNFVLGFEMLQKQMEDALKSQKIKKIEPKIGEKFDSYFHQVFEIEQNNNVDSDTILKVISPGFKLHDRVIKPALVMISKKSN